MNQETIKYARKCPALTGSIATGKSTVAEIFKNLGAHIIDTDVIAREVVEPGHPGLEELIQLFGTEVLYPDGSLNREILRNIIIHYPEKRKQLDGILHPHINNRVYQLLDQYRNKDNSMQVIIDVPLLFEAGWDKLFNITIVVYVPVEIQVERLMIRDSIDRLTAEKNVAAQFSIEEKRKKASIVIDNSGSRENTAEQSVKIFKQICNEWRNDQSVNS
ncbi:MAG: dephospho-CoA kinase [Spirochaetes bacterium]|jgi:dephospho-CoA kinase|nr:dephospho-CoA kinase [Spirochaetota bacterium]